MITRESGAARWSVDPDDGGRLTSLRVSGQELIAAPGDVALPAQAARYAYGAFPMVPWAGRIGRGDLEFDGRSYVLPTRDEPHALHGTTYDRAWEVTASDHEGVALRIDLGPSWPFAGEATMHWHSIADGLRLRIAVHAQERMPVWIGVHPWWLRTLADGRVGHLDFDAQQMYVRGADGLPTGELIDVPAGPWDDCFTGVTRARMTWDDLTLTMTASTGTWVVFDERPESFCVEPQTGPPDAVRLGLAPTIDAGQEHALDVDFRWS